jgi:HSP20 family protein
MDDEKEKKDEEKRTVDIDFGSGKVSFGGIFKGLGNLIDLATKMGEDGTQKSGTLSGLPKNIKGVYGFSLKALDGKPIIESFGNIKETEKGPQVATVREPITDLFDENDHLVVIAELPGVEEETISVEISQDILNLSASGNGYTYEKELLLTQKVVPSSLVKTYKNGIVHIRLDKEKEGSDT